MKDSQLRKAVRQSRILDTDKFNFTPQSNLMLSVRLIGLYWMAKVTDDSKLGRDKNRKENQRMWKHKKLTKTENAFWGNNGISPMVHHTSIYQLVTRTVCRTEREREIKPPIPSWLCSLLIGSVCVQCVKYDIALNVRCAGRDIGDMPPHRRSIH